MASAVANTKAAASRVRCLGAGIERDRLRTFIAWYLLLFSGLRQVEDGERAMRLVCAGVRLGLAPQFFPTRLETGLKFLERILDSHPGHVPCVATGVCEYACSESRSVESPLQAGVLVHDFLVNSPILCVQVVTLAFLYWSKISG